MLTAKEISYSGGGHIVLGDFGSSMSSDSASGFTATTRSMEFCSTYILIAE